MDLDSASKGKESAETLNKRLDDRLKKIEKRLKRLEEKEKEKSIN